MEELTITLTNYLLDQYFSSKRAMAEAIGISYRTLLNVAAGRGSKKNVYAVSSHLLRYCIQHHISLEPALQQS